MRIVSLLPSLTELVCTLGRRDDLVGVTHECDDPPGVEQLPHLTRSRIPGAATGAEIDAMVSEQAGSLYELDEALLAELRPALILTQEQCDVCAVNEVTVRRAAMSLPGRPQVESVNPTTLGQVFAMFRRSARSLIARPKPTLWSADSRRPSGRSRTGGPQLAGSAPSPRVSSSSNGSIRPSPRGTGTPRSFNWQEGLSRWESRARKPGASPGTKSPRAGQTSSSPPRAASRSIAPAANWSYCTIDRNGRICGPFRRVGSWSSTARCISPGPVPASKPA